MTVINRMHGFIFLKTLKTAGTSLEINFIKNTVLGNDIYHTCTDIRKHGFSTNRRSNVLKFGDQHFFLKIPRYTRKLLPQIHQHQSAKEVRNIVGDVIWNRSLIVCGVRNPWDLFLSVWRWRSRGRGGRSKPIETPFEKWGQVAMNGEEEERKRVGAFSPKKALHKYLFIEQEFVIDKFIYFENLQDSLQQLSEDLGVWIPSLEVHEKASPDVDYREYYSDELAEEVGEYFSDIIELTGYTF